MTVGQLQMFVNEAYDAISDGVLLVSCGYGAGSLLGRSPVPLYISAKNLVGVRCGTYALSSPEKKGKRIFIFVALAISGVVLGIIVPQSLPLTFFFTTVFFGGFAHGFFKGVTGTTPRNIFAELSGGYIMTTEGYENRS